MICDLQPTRPALGGHLRGFAQRVEYICRKQMAGLVLNLPGGWQKASARMALTAQLLNIRTRKPDLHVVLSWHASEQVTIAQMLEAGKMWLAKMGAGAHQAVLAVHGDRRQMHLHIVLNRVHPVTGAVLSLWDSYKAAELACREIELHFDWPQDRGRFDAVIEEGQVSLQPKPSEHWAEKQLARARGLRPSSLATRGSSLIRGAKLLRDDFAADPVENERRVAALRKALRQAATWGEVHAHCAHFGLVLQQHRSGGRIISCRDGRHMAAGELGSACSLPRLEARLGPFEAAPTPAIAAHDGPAVKAAQKRRRVKVEALRLLSARHEQEKSRLEALLGPIRSPVASVLRKALRLDQAGRMKQMRARFRTLAAVELSFFKTASERLTGALARRIRAANAFAIAQGARPLRSPSDHTGLRQILDLTAPQGSGLPDQVTDAHRQSWMVLTAAPKGPLVGFARRGPEALVCAEGTAHWVELQARQKPVVQPEVRRPVVKSEEDEGPAPL